MPVNKYITASCVISNHVIYKEGKAVFENKAIPLSGFLLSAYDHLGVVYPKFYKMDMLGKLGWLAAEVLLKDRFRKENYRPEDTGIVLSNANSSLDTDAKYLETTRDFASPSLFVYTLPNIVIGEICIRHQFKGENAFFVFEKFDATFIEQYVSYLVNNNILQSCICGWVDVLNEDYKAVLYLVEKTSLAPSLEFTVENILNIYQLENG